MAGLAGKNQAAIPGVLQMRNNEKGDI